MVLNANVVFGISMIKELTRKHQKAVIRIYYTMFSNCIIIYSQKGILNYNISSPIYSQS